MLPVAVKIKLAHRIVVLWLEDVGHLLRRERPLEFALSMLLVKADYDTIYIVRVKWNST